MTNADVSSLTVRVCESADIEPPTPLAGRPLIAMPYDPVGDEWGASCPYGVDLNVRDQVRVVVTLTTVGGAEFRLLDATAVFVAPDGL